MRFLQLIFFVGSLLFGGTLFAQAQNYSGINIQGQHKDLTSATVSINFYIIEHTNDTLWAEEHTSVPVSPEGSYALVLGHGTYLSGSMTLFENIDWYDVQKVVARRMDISPAQDILDLNMISLPYAMHSMTVQTIPAVTQLDDVTNSTPNVGQLVKYDGGGFYIDDDLIGDTSTFAYYGGQANFADTAWVAVMSPDVADTSGFSYYADSANYAWTIGNVPTAGTANFADTADVALLAQNAWKINGNAGLTASDYIGTSTNHNLQLGTNNQPRLTFSASDSSVYNQAGASGFRIDAKDGVLFTPNTSLSAIQNFNDSYFYFDPMRSAFICGDSMTFDLDTTMGQYSFAFGKNVGTNGTNSAVFGCNVFGDSTDINGTIFPAVSSFSVGKNNKVSYTGVALGENCNANWLRNVAIGYNATANNQSSGIAVGYNVLVEGSTSWAMGKNIQATSNFSTVLGSYVSSGTNTGCFMWGDASTTDTLYPMATYSFNARASGGVVFYSSTDLLNGVSLAPGGGSWNMISDQNKKDNILLLNPNAFKPRFHDLNVYAWNYKSNPTTHVGPMAQDFFAAFGVGELNTYINMLDADGVALLGIKLLKQEIDDKSTSEEKISETENQIENEKSELDELEKRIKELYEKMD